MNQNHRDPNPDWMDDESIDARLDKLLESSIPDELPPGQLTRLRKHLDELLGDGVAIPVRKPFRWFRPAIAGLSLVTVVLLFAIPFFDRTPSIDPVDIVAETKNDPAPIDYSEIDLAQLNHSLRPQLERLLQLSPQVSSIRTARAAGSAVASTSWTDRAKQLGENALVKSLESMVVQIDQRLATAYPRTREARAETKQLAKWRREFPEQLARTLRQRNRALSRKPTSMFAEIPQSLISERVLFRVICHTCNRNLLRDLAGWIDDPAVGKDVCAAWSRLADSQSLAELAASCKSDSSRIALLTTLLERGDQTSVGLYLETASRLDRIDLVLISAQNTKVVPAEWMIQALGSTRQSIVRCAAAALSQDSRAEVTVRLAEQVRSPQTARGALLALAGRSDPTALEISSSLQSDLRNTALFKSAQRQWNSMMQVTVNDTRFRVPLDP